MSCRLCAGVSGKVIPGNSSKTENQKEIEPIFAFYHDQSKKAKGVVSLQRYQFKCMFLKLFFPSKSPQYKEILIRFLEYSSLIPMPGINLFCQLIWN